MPWSLPAIWPPAGLPALAFAGGSDALAQKRKSSPRQKPEARASAGITVPVDPAEQTFEFLRTILKDAGITPAKAGMLAGQFSSLESFMKADFMKTVFVHGADGKVIQLGESQRKKAEMQKSRVNPQAGLKENWIRYLAESFVKRQIENIDNISLDAITVNPFLMLALRLQTPEELIRFNVYQSATRSIVTSMGFTLEKMVGRSGARMGEKGEWYDVVKEVNSLTYWIQVKSGPNDVDKDQVVHFNKKFNDTEATKNYYARLGIAYGKRNAKTVSMGHIKSYLENWEERLLVGRELWDFVSDDAEYHLKVLEWIDSASTNMLGKRSINDRLEGAVRRITDEFEARYGKGSAGIRKCMDDSM